MIFKTNRWSVYLITNSKTNKSYVGFTSGSVDSRLKQHFYAATRWRKAKSPLACSIRKHGETSFSVITLHKYHSREQALKAEKHFIKKFNTFGYPNGYNATLGGEGATGAKSYTRTKAHRKAQAQVLARAMKESGKFFDKKHLKALSAWQKDGNGMTGKHWYTNGKKEAVYFESDVPKGWYRGRSTRLLGKQNGFYGKKHTEETISAIRAKIKPKKGSKNPASVEILVGKRKFKTKKSACSFLGITRCVLERRLTSSDFPKYKVIGG